MNGERFSDLMKAFISEVMQLEVSAKTAILGALKAAVVPVKNAFRTLEDRTVLQHHDVSLDGLLAVVPDFLRTDAKDLARSLAKEVAKRGETWAAEGAHLAVQTFMTAPLEAHLAPKPAAAMTTADVAKVAESAVALALPAAVRQAVADHARDNAPPVTA